MLESAKSLLAVEDNRLDADPWLFNVENGTIDLRTGRREKHDSRDLLTKIAPVRANRHAKCALFKKFLKRITGDDAPLRSFIQKAKAASVIGRRFDPQLLAAALGGTGDVDVRLAAMQALDLVHLDSKASDYVFKHALVRDSLYQSLLTEARRALHFKVAEEVERRSGNRLTEVAEILAQHYSQTDRAEKAFTYLSMAGSKSLSVYSVDEATTHFTAALALLDKNPNCASDQQIAELLVGYTLCSNMSARFKSTIEIVERFTSSLDRSGDNHKCVLVQHHYVLAVLWSGRYREAEKAQADLSAMAAKLHDVSSRAYALASHIIVSTIIAPNCVEVFEAVSCEASTAASNVNDAYLQCFLRYVLGWEEIHRGRMAKARQAAEELMAVGQRMNDPRSIGFGRQLEACPVQHGGRVKWSGQSATLFVSATHETRSDPQRLLDETPHLPNGKVTTCHRLPRIKTFRSNS